MNTRTARTSGTLGDRRGVALAFVVALMVTLLCMGALAVDMGMLFNARTEAQRSADAAALSGALSLYQDADDEAGARAMAIDYGGRNTIQGLGADVLEGDVDVDLTLSRVTVRVFRTALRGSAISNIFARIFGANTSDVSAMAAAHVGVSNGVNCPLPMVLVDRWWETNDAELAEQTDTWDAGVDIYNEGPLEAMPGSPSEPTGYGMDDRGGVLSIYPGSPSGTPVPGWAFLLELNDPGGNEVKYWIQGCRDPDVVFEYGDEIEVKNGMTVGPVGMGVDSLIALDPTAYWDVGMDCVTRPGAGECVSSPRIKPAFLISPEDIPTGGGGNAMVTLQNFVGLFVICTGVLEPSQQSCTGNINSPGGGLHVRFIEYQGVSVSPAGQNSGSLVRTIQLVQ